MRFIAFLLFVVFLIFALFARAYFVCDILHQCVEPVEEPTGPVYHPRAATLDLTQEDSVLLSGYDEFYFAYGEYQPEINDNNQAFLDTLALLMAQDSLSRLQITGFYLDSEKDLLGGFQENMGLARAAAIQEVLIARGLDEARLALSATLLTADTLTRPLSFNLDITPNEFAIASYTFTNMTYSDANFESDSYKFTPGPAFLAYADSVKTYMGLHPEKTITVIGHTDSQAGSRYNMKLGQRRAESAKDFLQNLGIDNQISAISKGETEFVATNKTPEGRQANRRVNIVIE